MEISVEQRMTGRDVRNDILHRHGGVEALEQAAQRGDPEAQDDLATVRLLEEEPRRLDEVYHVREVSRVTPRELARLSEVRLRILELLDERGGMTAAELAHALHLGPEPARRHLRALRGLGMIRELPWTPRKHVATPGLDIHITTSETAAEPA